MAKKATPLERKKNGQKEVAKKDDTKKRITATLSKKNAVQVNMVRNFYPQTGCTTADGAETLVVLSLGAIMSDSDAEAAKKADDLLAMMGELKPQDGFEGIMISQMIMVHKQAMAILGQANLEGNRNRRDIQESLISRYVKLMRLYTQQLEALDKHRRGGNQKMTVEHVHVHEGGQAIVGNVNQGGGGKDEN
jgi:hypothetical protein